MKFNYVTLNKSDIKLHDIDVPEDISIYDILCIDDDICGTIMFDNYVAFVLEDYYSEVDDDWHFIIFKLNTNEYDKRLSEVSRGYHKGMFWLSNELYDEMNEDNLNDIFAYDELVNKFRNESIYT